MFNHQSRRSCLWKKKAANKIKDLRKEEMVRNTRASEIPTHVEEDSHSPLPMVLLVRLSRPVKFESICFLSVVSERKRSSNTSNHVQSSIKKIVPLEKKAANKIKDLRKEEMVRFSFEEDISEIEYILVCTLAKNLVNLQEYSGTKNSYTCRRRLTESFTNGTFGKVCAPVAAQGKTRALKSDCKE
nr:hypothetical protein [Tanacetum cinerariifolium]